MSSEPIHALNLDIKQQQSFIRYYNSLPAKPSTTIRFFNRNDYYTVHGEDATFANQQSFISNPIKYMGDEPKLSYLVINKNNFEKLIRELLLVKQYRVEVYTKPSQSHNNDWILEYKGSPGNQSQFEDILYANDDIVYNNCVLGVKLGAKKVIGISCINTTDSNILVTEITDDEFFTVLESVIAQVSPRECVIPQGDTPDLVTIKNMIDRNGILAIPAKKAEFSSTDLAQDLNRLLYFAEGQQRDASVFPETNYKEAMDSLQAVIKHLHLTGDQQNFNQFKISHLDVNQYVRLDNAAIGALNLLPKPGTSIRNADMKNSNILGILTHCTTPQGKRLLEQWIKQPLKDINLINERLDIVEALFKDAEARQVSSNYLKQIPDMMMLAKKMGAKKASLKDCYRVYQAVNSIPGMIQVLRKLDNNCMKAVLVNPISDSLSDMDKYQSMIEQTVDMDVVNRGEYFIKPSFDEELQDLSKQKQELEEKMQRELKKAMDELGFDNAKKIKLECDEQHGYFFRVTIAEEPVLRQKKKFRIIDAVKGGVRFTNDKLEDLNSSYSRIKQNYKDQQKVLEEEIFNIAAGYAETIRNLNLSLAKVDVLVSLAIAAASAPIPYVRPKMYEPETGILELHKVRHPCLEKQDGISVIPNSVKFKKHEKTFFIITGPNMGGKSTYIKSIGVSVLMAHIGSFVPCEKAEISCVDGILARVGAEDSELKRLSTFALEMVETAGIVRSATANSLVIIDELGRGTSTYDGCGIAWAIAEYLAKKVKSYSLFATHFNEITHLEDTVPEACNLHVTAVTTDKTITPLYQIREGPCDRSYGIHCARMVGFPEDVIEFAANHQKILEDEQGMKYIKDYEEALKRKVIEESDTVIVDALRKLKNLSPEINIEQINEVILGELANNDNLFVKGLLKK